MVKQLPVLTAQSRLRAINLLLAHNNLHEASWALRTEFHPEHPVSAVRAAYFESEDQYGISSRDILESRREQLQAQLVEEATRQKSNVREPLAKAVTIPKSKSLKPLEQVLAALRQKSLRHTVEGRRVVIPLKSNIRPIQALEAEHGNKGGMYEKTVAKYLQSLRIPGHSVSATWVERQEEKAVKQNPLKPAAKPFVPIAKPRAKSVEAQPDDDFKGGEEREEKPPAPTTVSEDVVEIHVKLKKR